jgi:hypothetical protein
VIIRERAAYRRPTRRGLHVGAPAPVPSLAPAPAAVLPAVMADTVSATAEGA